MIDDTAILDVHLTEAHLKISGLVLYRCRQFQGRHSQAHQLKL